MEITKEKNQDFGTCQSENGSKWRVWDSDFIAMEEIKALRALVSAGSDNPPYSFRSKGRGRIKLALGECTLPNVKANTYQLSSSSKTPLKLRSPDTGRYCKVIGRGRGRGRHTQVSHVEIGQKVEHDIDDQQNRESCLKSDGSKNIQDNKDVSMNMNQSPNEVKDQDHEHETVIDYIKSLEEPDKWILIDGIPEKDEERKELLSTIEAFGMIESISYHDKNKALIRMSKMFDCEWIISCLNGNQVSASSNTFHVSRATEFLDVINDIVTMIWQYRGGTA